MKCYFGKSTTCAVTRINGKLVEHPNMNQEVLEDGFSIIDNIFTDKEIDRVLFEISKADSSRFTFRKTNSLFAIR